MKTLLVLISMALCSPPGYSCECAIVPSQPGERHEISVFKNALAKSDVIFFGKVLKLNDQNMEEWETIHQGHHPVNFDEEMTKGIMPLFKVLKTIKGDPGTDKSDTLQVYQHWSLCDMSFDKSANYLVFAYGGKDGKLYTSRCFPNKRIGSEEELEEIISYLKNKETKE